MRAHLESLWTASGIILAVSGGPDSVAMMHILARYAKASERSKSEDIAPNPLSENFDSLGLAPLFPPLYVVTIDHHLRPESGFEAAKVGEWANHLGLEHQILHWSPGSQTSALQERSRLGRYALLSAYAHKRQASHICFAHTQEDQAETILFRLSRGSSVKGLSGMTSYHYQEGLHYIRPLLHVSKQTLLTLCHQEKWPYFIDPSNNNLKFARPRFRKLLLELEPEGLSVQRLCKFGERMKRIEEVLENIVHEKHKEALQTKTEKRDTYHAAAIFSSPFEIICRIFARIISERPAEIDFYPKPSTAYPPSLHKLERIVEKFLHAYHHRLDFTQTFQGQMILLRSSKSSCAASSDKEKPEQREVQLIFQKENPRRFSSTSNKKLVVDPFLPTKSSPE